MTAALITLKRRDPAVIAGRAHYVLDAAARMNAQWPAEGRDAIGTAALELDVALDMYGALDSGSVHWEQLYAHLSAEADPHEAALEKAAEESASAMAALLTVIAVFCGTEVADEIKSITGVGK